MFRILITALIFFTLTGCDPVFAGSVLDGGCYDDCTLVNSNLLTCASTGCQGTHRPQFGIDGANLFFKRSTYSDTCKYYNGTIWIPCGKKRYDGSAWVASDAKREAHYLEAMYMMMLDTMPARPTILPGNWDKTNPMAALDTSTVVECNNVIASRTYQNFTTGAVNAYPVRLRCREANTWTGDREFFIHPGFAQDMLATFMLGAQDNIYLAVGLTSFTAGSFVLGVSLISEPKLDFSNNSQSYYVPLF